MITVMGATGQIGGGVARRLLAEGVAVRALGRSEERLAELAALGAETMAGDAGDADWLAEAFTGADALFAMLPFDPSVADYRAYQDRLGEAIVAAARVSGVRRIAALSSIGAEQPSGTGVLVPLHAQEARLRQLDGVDVLLLRPGAFMENFREALPVIEQHGMYAAAVAPDAPVPMVAAGDVAAAAARALASGAWHGVEVREVLGPRDVTFAEATRILGAQLGRPGLPYVQLPGAEMEAVLRANGFSADAARTYVEFELALGSGKVRSVEGRNAGNSAGRSFEEVVAEMVAGAAGTAGPAGAARAAPH